MKAIKDVVLKVKIERISYLYLWTARLKDSYNIGGSGYVRSDFYKTKLGCVNNMKKFMQINGFKFEIVGE